MLFNWQLYLVVVYFRVENEDSITEEPNQQNGNGSDVSIVNPFSRDALTNAQQKAPTIGLSLRNLSGMRNQPPLPPLTNGDSNPNQTIALDSDSEISTHNHSYKRTLLKNPSSAKFEAFGHFMASSLIDLPEKDALELVEKFTSELVKTLIASKTDATVSPDKE